LTDSQGRHIITHNLITGDTMKANTKQVRNIVKQALDMVIYTYACKIWTDTNGHGIRTSNARRIVYEIASNDLQSFANTVTGLLVSSGFDNGVRVSQNKYLRISSFIQ
jgi:hypothetical protein